MKHTPIVIIVALAAIVAAQSWTTAGPRDTPPRTVPVNVMDVMQPSRMVAVTHVQQNTDILEQVQIPLEPGQVFVLTSWTAFYFMAELFEGPTDSPGNLRTKCPKEHNTVFPTGIRFPRDAAGLADIYMKTSGGGEEIPLQGYITDDY